MDPISKFVQSLQKRPNIQETILRFPAPSPLMDFFLIPINLFLFIALRSAALIVVCAALLRYKTIIN